MTLHWNMETSTRKGPYLLTLHWKISLTIAASSGINSFCVKKCGDDNCNICKPPRQPPEIFLKFIIFETLFWHLMGITSHFLTCMVRQQPKPTIPHWQNILGEPKLFPLLPVFSMYTVYHLCSNVKNAACGTFCILQESCLLLHNRAGDHYTFTCGATLSDLELTCSLSKVCICDLQCYNPFEKLYYSMNYHPICFLCCSEDNIVSVQGCYPQCENCKHKVPVKRVWS